MPCEKTRFPERVSAFGGQRRSQFHNFINFANTQLGLCDSDGRGVDAPRLQPQIASGIYRRTPAAERVKNDRAILSMFPENSKGILQRKQRWPRKFEQQIALG